MVIVHITVHASAELTRILQPQSEPTATRRNTDASNPSANATEAYGNRARNLQPQSASTATRRNTDRLNPSSAEYRVLQRWIEQKQNAISPYPSDTTKREWIKDYPSLTLKKINNFFKHRRASDMPRIWFKAELTEIEKAESQRLLNEYKENYARRNQVSRE